MKASSRLSLWQYHVVEVGVFICLARLVAAQRTIPLALSRLALHPDSNCLIAWPKPSPDHANM
jgi:hypothetical protein